MLKCGLNGPTLCHTKNGPFLGSSGRRVQLAHAAAIYLPGINRRPNLCPPGTGPTRLRQEGWLQSRRGLEGNASGAKQERAERKKVLALAQARKVDVILVTELTRWGRSARFAARSLTCFKFRFVSSPRFDFRNRFCHSAPMETHAFGFRLQANARRAKSDFLSVL